jgi:hypothetical protein
MRLENKLECFSTANMISLVYYIRVSSQNMCGTLVSFQPYLKVKGYAFLRLARHQHSSLVYSTITNKCKGELKHNSFKLLCNKLVRL